MKILLSKIHILALSVFCLTSTQISAQQPELVVHTKHSVGIQSITFSNDKKLLATGGFEGTIKLWEVETGRQIKTLPGHPPLEQRTRNFWEGTYEPTSEFAGAIINNRLDLPASLSFSPDGKFLASGSNSGTIIIWDVLTGTKKITIDTLKGVWFVAFSTDGKVLLSESNLLSEEGNYRYWDTITGKELNGSGRSSSLFYLPRRSPDKSLKLEYSEEAAEIKVHDTRKKSLVVLTGHEAGIRQAVFSPTEQLLASGGWDRTVRIWDLNKKTSRIFGRHDSVITFLSFSHDGMLIASGSADLTVKLWDVQSGKELMVFSGYNIDIDPVSFSKDAKFFITRSEGTVHNWNIKKGEKYAAARIHPGNIQFAMFSPDKTKLVTSDQSVRDPISLIRSMSGDQKLLEALKFPKIKFPKDIDDWIVYLQTDMTIKLWNAETGALIKPLEGHTDQISALAFSRDGKVLASGGDSRDCSIKLWNIDTDEKPITLTGHKNAIKALVFSDDGKFLASGDDKGAIHLWNLKEKSDKLLSTAGQKIVSLFFLSDGTTLVSFEGKYDAFRMTERNLETGKVIDSFIMSENPDKVSHLLDKLPNVFQRMNFSWTDDSKYFALRGLAGKVGIYARASLSENNFRQKPLAWLIPLENNDWVISSPDGRFDTNNLENPKGINWIFPDQPLKPLSFEIFMQDYYEPRLLPRLLNCTEQKNCKQKEFAEIPSLASLNRNQPRIEKVSVSPQKDKPDLVDVSVMVSSVSGECFRNNKYEPCESGVYDLRVYRESQLVGQSSHSDSNTLMGRPYGRDRQKFLDQWRLAHALKNKQGQPVSSKDGKQEIVFKNIRLPKRADVSQVEFTAYAFNEDRVKSETSPPAVYKLSQPRPGAKPRAYIVTIGVDATSVPNVQLSYAPISARSIDTFLKEKLAANYEIVTTQFISDKLNIDQKILPKKDTIKALLETLSGRTVSQQRRQNIPNQEKLQAATPDDLVFIYIASHGYVDPKGTFYVMPYDLGDSDSIRKGEVTEEFLNGCLNPDKEKENCIAATEYLQHSISSVELTDWLQLIDAGEMSLILDSCHAAGITGPGFKPGPMGDRGFGQLSYDKRMQVLAATQVENLAQGTLFTEGRSLLAYALTKKGSQIKHDQSQPFNRGIWLSETEDEVPKLYDEYVLDKQLRQEPVFLNFARR